MIDYNSFLSSAAKQIKPSGIRKFFDISATMEDCISLGVGEPDFVTPWHIRDAGIISLEKGHTHYTANRGIQELRDGISNYLKRRFNLEYKGASEILITVGGSEAIDAALRALINPGDEVLIPEPSFVCYTPITSLTGGVPVPVKTYMKDNFKLTAENIEKSITPRSKILILPYPNNPTGAIMSREELEKIAQVVLKYNLIVLSDEIYAELTYSQKHVSIASIEGMRERCVVINGFSKTYAMTGWRLGYAAGPAEIISIMTKIHQYAIMSAPTTAQFAAIQAVNCGDDDIEYMKGEYDSRRKLILEGLASIGIDCFEPKGAFYVFPSIEKFGMSSDEFCIDLLEKQKVAVIPGNAFGESGEGFVRISYAYSPKKITAALERIECYIKENF